MRLDQQPNIPAEADGMRRRVSDLIKRTNEQLNGLTEGRMSANHAARTSVPTTGTWAVGDYVHKSNPSEAGTTPNKYIVHGWKRLTNGSANVLNTDWFEDRRLTGN
jgi:hypothetical protein